MLLRLIFSSSYYFLLGYGSDIYSCTVLVVLVVVDRLYIVFAVTVTVTVTRTLLNIMIDVRVP